jgi:DedD protein
MAFFRFRKNNPPPQDGPGARNEPAAPAETVETLRRRALYRLIGAAVLVLAAIIGFPMLFDTQPRPVVVQAPIIIPDRDTAPPLALPASAAAAQTLSASAQVSAATSLTAGEEMIAPADNRSASGAIAPASPAASSAVPAAPAPDVQPKPPTAKPAAKSAAVEKRKADDSVKRQRDQADAARARALLDGKNVTPPAAPNSAAARRAQEGRYAIQIGAFASAGSAQAARQKAEHAGVKTYTQSVTTKTGPVTRVRAGPFASRDEAARAQAKLKQAGLTGSIIAP